jgi:hypothetical protein
MFRHLGWAGILAVVALAPATPSQAQARASWSSDPIGLQVISPGGWGVVVETPKEVVFAPPFGGGKIAVFSLPAPTEEEASPELEELAEAAVDSLKASFKKFKLLQERAVEVAGLPAWEIFFSGRRDGEKIRSVQTIVLRHGHQVLFVYMAPDDEYTRSLGDYDQTLRSVRWLETE